MTTQAHLTDGQLGELEAELQRERRRLARALEGSMAHALSGDADRIAPYDDGAPSRLRADAGDAAARARLQVIDDALRRLHAGRYGACAGCEQPIPYGRLLVMPETDRCVACGPRG